MDFRSCAFPPRRRFAFLHRGFELARPRGGLPRNPVWRTRTGSPEGLARTRACSPSPPPSTDRLPALSRVERGSRPSTGGGRGHRRGDPGRHATTPRPHDPRADPVALRLGLRATGPATGYTGVYRGVSACTPGTENPIRKTLLKKEVCLRGKRPATAPQRELRPPQQRWGGRVSATDESGWSVVRPVCAPQVGRGAIEMSLVGLRKRGV
jgi:hypothetical protein